MVSAIVSFQIVLKFLTLSDDYMMDRLLLNSARNVLHQNDEDEYDQW
jgi:hypothetical protein